VPGLPLGGRLLGDERLAKLASKGSESAFAALYERHHQAIYRYCRSILHNDQDAQDALQSAMMRAYAALRSQERELAVKPWLFRIAHNESISLLRKRRPEDVLSDAHEQPESGVERTLETRQRLATLLADLRALPERQRAALTMRELSGLSIEQIAGALEMSPGAAKQALFEARNSLHELSEGRAMPCESVREAISQRDGRVLRSRRIRAHLRACEDCRAFRAAIGARSADLAALAPPLPPSLAGALLGRLLAHGGGHSGGGALAGGSGAGSGALGSGTLASSGSGASLAGHAASASLLGKGVAGIAALAVVAAGTTHFATSSNRRTVPAPSGARVPGSSSAGGTGGSLAATARGRHAAPASKLAGQVSRGSSSSAASSSKGKPSGHGPASDTGSANRASRSTANRGLSHWHDQGSGRAKAIGPSMAPHDTSRRKAASRSWQGARNPSAKGGSRGGRPGGSSHANARQTKPVRRKPPPRAPAHSPASSETPPAPQANAGLRHRGEARPEATAR
jgi:RNA polymerase sigma factor (sigma-70 family)